MRNQDLGNGNPASHWIHFHFDDGCGIRVSGRRSHAAAFVKRGRFWRSVGAHRANRAETCLGQADGFLKGETLFRRSGVEYALVSKAQSFFRYFQFFRNGVGNDRFSAFRSLQCRVSRHQRDAARIGTEIHGAEVGVTGKQPNVKRVDAQNFGNNSSKNIVRSLTDLRRTAENAYAAAAVEFELNSRMRHFVPVDGKTGAGQISGASQPYPAAFRKLAEFFIPVGDFDNAANTVGKIDGPKVEEICSHGVWRFHDAEPQLRRVNLELFGDLVELDFLAETRLRSTMPALGPAGRLVRESAAALVKIAWDMIRGRLQRAGVERASNSVRAIRPAVNQCLKMHSGDRAIHLDAGLEFHQDGMATTVTIENFFACEADLNRPIEDECGLGDNNFVIEGITLSAETSAVGCGDHADVCCRHLQHFGKRAMEIMWRLRAGPDG